MGINNFYSSHFHGRARTISNALFCFSRTVHSLVVLLSMFQNVKLVFISPQSLEMPESIIEEIQQSGTQIVDDLTLDHVRLFQNIYHYLNNTLNICNGPPLGDRKNRRALRHSDTKRTIHIRGIGYTLNLLIDMKQLILVSIRMSTYES